MLRRFLLAMSLAALAAACRHDTPSAPPPHQGRDVVLPRETETIDAVVPRHATLESVLKSNHLTPPFVEATLASAASVFDPRQLRADRPYRLVRFLDGALQEFEYQIDVDRFLRIVCRERGRPDSVESQVGRYEKDTATVAIRGHIDAAHASVVAAIDAAGETIQLAMALAEMFAGQIDFESDLQPGDSFDVMFEKSTRDGQFAGYGPILSARFRADGHEHQAFRWNDPVTGKAAFYDENGRSLKRFFLRSPLKFEPRITSGFSMHRLHPVYRTYRAHLGIDYAAPPGAPVVAVSSGTVVSAGWSGGGGNMVRIRHASGFESYYLHLSAFGKGIRPSAHVDQGQMIGRVGSTGTATGPHLDYRLKKNGTFVNPLAEHRKLPPGEPVPDGSLSAFNSARDALLREMSTARAASDAPLKHDAVTAIR
jgi:murein DD-endopeptidase MepM/ murein hydrolase activator NlpD